MMKSALVTLIGVLSSVVVARADFAIYSFDSTGQLSYNTLSDGTNYNYQVEWAPSPAGPWSAYSGAGSWQEIRQAAPAEMVTNTVPMCYRVVASPGDYMVVDISEGTNATQYPITYYRTLADLPGGVGVDSDAYKTTNMVFRRIPAGTFVMGSPTNELGRDSDERKHQVTLTQFYIGVFEVTQKQWERVMGTWPSYFTNTTYRDSRPVDQVTYYQIRENPDNSDDPAVDWPTNSTVNAQSFMGLLRARTGKAFDLPTESQWEYAGRAGTTTALNSGKNLTETYICPNMSAVGRYWYNGGSEETQNGDITVGSAKVGSYPPNAWGLYDIHGNVSEWCLDWWGSYPLTAVSDPGGPDSYVYRVFRGGSWYYDAYYCRVGGYRDIAPPDYNLYKFIGFRVALPSGQ